ncbi:MAG: DUF1987 domain-containing protein [Calditrichaeota bacterium]|nr:MAG: DUF1987 domain-containing protein [Calditrichota bacterium]
MEHLKLDKTKFTLAIDFNPNGTLEMEGSSYPESAAEFFAPVYDWLNRFVSEVGTNITLNLRFDYLNTSSVKCVLNILEILESYQENSDSKIVINWYSEEDDEDIFETGEELAEDSSLNFNFISY